MPKCPNCQKEVSLIYQIVIPFKNPSLIARNWAIKRFLDKIMVCGSCGKELTLTENGLIKCRKAMLKSLGLLLIIWAGWIVIIRFVWPINIADKVQVIMFVTIPGVIVFLAAYVHIWRAVEFKRTNPMGEGPD